MLLSTLHIYHFKNHCNIALKLLGFKEHSSWEWQVILCAGRSLYLKMLSGQFGISSHHPINHPIKILPFFMAQQKSHLLQEARPPPEKSPSLTCQGTCYLVCLFLQLFVFISFLSWYTINLGGQRPVSRDPGKN